MWVWGILSEESSDFQVSQWKKQDNANKHLKKFRYIDFKKLEILISFRDFRLFCFFPQESEMASEMYILNFHSSQLMLL